MRQSAQRKFEGISLTGSYTNLISHPHFAKHTAITFKVRLVYIQYSSILTMQWYVACNHSCFDSGSVSFQWSHFSCSPMTDVFRLSRACACPRQSVLKWVCLSLLIVQCVCLCANLCVPFPSSTLTSLNSWLSLSSHSRGRLFSQLLGAIQCGSITNAAINTRGHGMHPITDIIEMASIRTDP